MLDLAPVLVIDMCASWVFANKFFGRSFKECHGSVHFGQHGCHSERNVFVARATTPAASVGLLPLALLVTR